MAAPNTNVDQAIVTAFEKYLTTELVDNIFGKMNTLGVYKKFNMYSGIDGGERLPISVEGARLGGIEHRNVPSSAQVKSAILLAGLGTNAPVSVIEPWPFSISAVSFMRMRE